MHGVCGNSVVEGWEECDCGSDPKLCQALCCVPNTGQPDGRTPCTRTSSAACSPSEGVCCTSNCSFAEVDVECKAATDCSAASTCSGTSPICPSAAPQPEGTECDGGARTCSRGTCTGSACQTLGLLPCPTPLTNDSTEACTAHCQDSEGICAPAASLVLPDGEECRQAGGFGHCRAGGCSVGGGDHPSIHASLSHLTLLLQSDWFTLKVVTRPGLLALLDALLPTLCSLSLLFGIFCHFVALTITFPAGATVPTVEEAGGPRIAVILIILYGAKSQEHNMVSNINFTRKCFIDNFKAFGTTLTRLACCLIKVVFPI